MELSLLLLLIALNGVFALSEIAVISSRKARLKKMADERHPGARAALSLQESPSDFLSTIQVGITVVAILTGAIGESSFTGPVAELIRQVEVLAPYAHALALVIVVGCITYLSVVIGELAPKQAALLNPEPLAAVVAKPMIWLSRVARPVVWLFGTSSALLLKLLPQPGENQAPVTNDEIRVLMAQGAEAGVFHISEREIVSNVLRLDEQSVRAIMTPRKHIYFLDLEDPIEELHKAIADCPYSRIPVCRGGVERISGVLHLADLLKHGNTQPTVAQMEAIARPPLVLPDTVTTTQLLEQLRRNHRQYAIVVDEYGDLQGLVTLHDVLGSIVGDLPETDITAEPDFEPLPDGRLRADASITVERLRHRLGIERLFDGENEDLFHTLGGYVLHVLGQIPKPGEVFDAEGLEFEVESMDGNRVEFVAIRSKSKDEPGLDDG